MGGLRLLLSASACVVASRAFARPRRVLLGVQRLGDSMQRMPLRTMMTASENEQKAVDDFRMITEDEANVRKTVGVGVGVVTAAVYATSGMAYSTLSACIFGAISTYRTGAEYQ